MKYSVDRRYRFDIAECNEFLGVLEKYEWISSTISTIALNMILIE